MMDDFKFLSSTLSFHFTASVGTTCKRKLKFDRPSVLEGESYKGFEVYNQEFPMSNFKVIVWQL